MDTEEQKNLKVANFVEFLSLKWLNKVHMYLINRENKLSGMHSFQREATIKF